MRIIRAAVDERIVHGAIQGDTVEVYCCDPITNPDAKPTGETLKLADVKLLAPVLPGKVVAIGVNYASHAAEMGDTIHEDPIIFLKPSTAVIGPEDTILRPASSQRVDHEAELALVIGKTCKDIRAEDAADYIYGYTCCNDVTARDLQKKDGQWTRGKGFDTFCPLGPWIETELDPADVGISARVNGEVRQNSRTKYLINAIPRLVEFVSAVMTLLPGDVITTGTPEGIGALLPGDVVEVEVEGVGILRNSVR